MEAHNAGTFASTTRVPGSPSSSEKGPFYTRPVAFVLAVLLPVAGAIVGIVALAKGRVGPGLALIATSVVAGAIFYFAIAPFTTGSVMTKDLKATIKTDLQEQLSAAPGGMGANGVVESVECAVDNSYNGRCLARVTVEGQTSNVPLKVTGGSDGTYLWEAE